MFARVRLSVFFLRYAVPRRHVYLPRTIFHLEDIYNTYAGLGEETNRLLQSSRANLYPIYSATGPALDISDGPTNPKE